MSLLCKKRLNPLQRRFGVLFSAMLLVTALLSLLTTSFHEGHLPIKPHTASQTFSYGISLLPVIPFLAMMLLIPRYIRQEKDEFVRALVMRALLLAFALPMLLDTVVGFVWSPIPFADAIPMFNIDLFSITALIALSIQIRRYQ